jgi:hypothetical protein
MVGEANVARVEILHDGHWLTGMAIQLVRPDAGEYLKLSGPTLRTGFQLALNTFGQPRTFELVDARPERPRRRR